MHVTSTPSCVGTRFFFSLVTYRLPVSVVIIAEYVLGLPIFFSSISLTRPASVYLAGGCVNFCSLTISIHLSSSPFLSSGTYESFSLAIGYTLLQPSKTNLEPDDLNSYPLLSMITVTVSNSAAAI